MKGLRRIPFLALRQCFLREKIIMSLIFKLFSLSCSYVIHMSTFRFDVWICVMQNITYEKKLWTDNLLSLISKVPHRKRYAVFVHVPYTVARFNAVSDIGGSPQKEICSRYSVYSCQLQRCLWYRRFPSERDMQSCLCSVHCYVVNFNASYSDIFTNSEHWFTTSFLRTRTNTHLGERCRKAMLGMWYLQCMLSYFGVFVIHRTLSMDFKIFKRRMRSFCLQADTRDLYFSASSEGLCRVCT